MSSPLISVIIPVYNGEKYIRECIDSILAQSFMGGAEIVIVDDGSQDNSYSIGKEYSEKFSQVKIIHQGNKGVTCARKEGVLAAKGQWICFVDADDSLPIDALSTLFNACAEKESDIVIGCIQDSVLSHLYSLDDCRNAIILGKYIPPCLWGKLFKKDLFDDSVFDIPRQITKGEDQLMNIRLLFKTEKVPAFVCKNVYNYRRNAISVSHTIKPTVEGAEMYDDARQASIPMWARQKYMKATVFNRLNGLTGIAYANPKSLCDKSTSFMKRLRKDIEKSQYKLNIQEWLLFNTKYAWAYKCLSFLISIKYFLRYRLGLSN